MECLQWCPVLDVTGDETLTTPEKIRIYGELVRSQHGLGAKLFGRPEIAPEVLEKLTQALFSCTTCGRCGEVCSVGINTQRLWPAMRAKMVELGVGPIGGQREMAHIVAEKHNPYDQPHDQRFAWLPAGVTIADAKRAEIGYFTGCSGAYTAQPMVAGALKMMHALDIDFTIFDNEYCCGFPLFVTGDLKLMEELIHHNVDGFAARGVKHLAVSCPCCMFMLQNHWQYFYGAPLPFDIIHITQLVKPYVDAGKVRPTKRLDATITYHDPCYLSRGTRVIDEPRAVLAQIPGARIVEMPHSRELSRCCGAGGGIRRAYPEISIQMARGLMREAESVGAEILVIDCPACYERLHLALQGWDSHLKVMDLMQLVTELL